MHSGPQRQIRYVSPPALFIFEIAAVAASFTIPEVTTRWRQSTKEKLSSSPRDKCLVTVRQKDQQGSDCSEAPVIALERCSMNTRRNLKVLE